MIFHITVKNSLENFIEQSEIKGITNLINDLEDIELIGAWQDSLDFSFYFVVKSKSYELIFDLITSSKARSKSYCPFELKTVNIESIITAGPIFL